MYIKQSNWPHGHDFMVLNLGCLHARMYVCMWDQYVCVRYLMVISNQGDKTKNDCVYRISKFLHGRYYWWRYLQWQNQEQTCICDSKFVHGMCINFLQRQFFSFLVLTIKQNTQKKITSMNQLVQRTQYEINGNLDY